MGRIRLMTRQRNGRFILSGPFSCEARMAVSKALSRRLQHVLGTEAGEAVVEWIDRTDTHIDELRADIAEVRHEVSSLREELRVGLARVDARFAEQTAALARLQSELVRWMVGFWLLSIVSVVGGVVALSQFVGRR
jgi:hypothetical protein